MSKALSFTEMASGLAYPEGPIALPDGSVIVVEVAAGRLSRIYPTGEKRVIASPGGAPSGIALGPDGAMYVCNGGEGKLWRTHDGKLESAGVGPGYVGGRIERIDISTGDVQVLYRECNGRRLSAPNDIVFDAHGGFYFTDLGQIRARDTDRGGVYYATPDGSDIREVVFPLETPNGIGLSPSGQELHVAETITGRLWSFEVTGPGTVRPSQERWEKGKLLAGLAGLQLFDSLAVQADGAVCVATLINGGITRVQADGSRVEHFPFPDSHTSNICFGGADHKTAFVTLSSSGRLVRCHWDAAGLPLNFGAPAGYC